MFFALTGSSSVAAVSNTNTATDCVFTVGPPYYNTTRIFF